MYKRQGQRCKKGEDVRNACHRRDAEAGAGRQADGEREERKAHDIENQLSNIEAKFHGNVLSYEF